VTGLSESERSAAVVRFGWWSLWGALLILLLKLLAWRLTSSVALLADALESCVNVLAAAAALVAIRIASEPPDEEHPFGHGKAEYFSAGFEGALIIVASFTISVPAALRLLDAPALEGLAPGAGVAVLAAILNGALALVLLRGGRRLSSPALEADGKHVAADVVTTAGALVGLGLAHLTGWWLLDPLVALIVALNILRVGVDVVRSAANGLMDTALNSEDQKRLRKTISESMGAGLQVHGILSRRASAHVFVEFHLVVPGSMTVDESHAICDLMEERIAELFHSVQTTIHVEPPGEAEETSEAVLPLR